MENAAIANISFNGALDIIAVPTIDVSVLTSAPQAALLLQSLSILAACTTDASLVNDKTSGMIKLLKTPKSFRASLYQTSASMSNAFRTADQAMLRIKINLDDIPAVMTSMVRAYARPEDRSSKFLSNLRMRNFKEIARICTDEATRAREKFDETLELIQELIQVTTATAGDNEEKVLEAKKLLDGYEEQRKVLEEIKEKLQSEIASQKVQIERAMVKYDKAAKKMTNGWNILGATFADTFKGVMKGVVGMFSNLRGGSGQQGESGGGSPSGGSGGQNFENQSDAYARRDRINNLIDGVASAGQNYGDSALGSYQKAADLAKDMYIYQRELEQVLLKQDAENRKAIAEIAVKLKSTEIGKLNLEEVIVYMSQGVQLLGNIQQQWSLLQTFFASLESVIIGPMARHLKDFDEIVQEEDLRESGMLRNELAITGLKAAAVCISVGRAAGIYNQVSKKYVLPLIDSSVVKMVMTQEEARLQLPALESRMNEITEESHEFIRKQLELAEKQTTDQMMTTKAGFEAALRQQQSFKMRIGNRQSMTALMSRKKRNPIFSEKLMREITEKIKEAMQKVKLQKQQSMTGRKKRNALLALGSHQDDFAENFNNLHKELGKAWIEQEAENRKKLAEFVAALFGKESD